MDSGRLACLFPTDDGEILKNHYIEVPLNLRSKTMSRRSPEAIVRDNWTGTTNDAEIQFQPATNDA